MLTRRSSLLLPLLIAACAEEEPKRDFPPLHYRYLLPLMLNVAAIKVEQRYVPAGVPPDVSQIDPMPPVQALQNMADDRLQALGGSGLAVFAIEDATLVRHGDTITGHFQVELDIYTAPNVRAGFAQASVSGEYRGDLDDLQSRLYDMTKEMMDRMNVEFEYQVRRNLGRWLLAPGAARTPVEQAPLTQAPLPLPTPAPRAP